MLLELRAENYAVIDRAVATFGLGLNLLTGETGAGKSILIDALALLLGGKASADVVRHGEEKAVVGCVFEMTPGAAAMLEANGIDCGGDDILLRREIVGERQRTRVYQQSAGDGGSAAAACAGTGAGAFAGRDAGLVRSGAAADCCWIGLAGFDGGCARPLLRGGRRRTSWTELQSAEQDRLADGGPVAVSEQGDRSGRAGRGG